MSVHDVEAGQLKGAEEILDMVLPSSDEATNVMHPCKESFHLPVSAIAAQGAPLLCSVFCLAGWERSFRCCIRLQVLRRAGPSRMLYSR
jgi:hypothetical protein